MSGTVPEIQVYFHDFGKDKEMTARRMYVDSGKLPLMTITEGQCRVSLQQLDTPWVWQICW